MYYNYNMYQPNRNMYRSRQLSNNNDRFFGGGFLAPLLLGGVAGYALGNNQPNYYYPQPFYYPNTYYNNFNYYPYYY